MHTTNYFSTFIAVSDDCPIRQAEEPPKKEPPSFARLIFESAIASPYKYTSDELIIRAKAVINGIPRAELKAYQEAFFSKGQPCLRCSALVKRYGWGIHFDQNGKLALVPLGSDTYKKLVSDETLEHTKGMKSKR